MTKISAIFSDVGGVLLTNGWDRPSRKKLADRFLLDWDDFEARHELIGPQLETGNLTLDHYLERTVFYRQRNFSPEEIKKFMFAQSRPLEGSLEIIARLAITRKYLLATLNNESRELNHFRIETFGLRRYFTVFFSSCFLGVKKPDEAVYRLALNITQRPPEECIFIDDRPLNLECAQRLGMKTVRFQSAGQLESDLRRAAVEF
jgi:putative hydrolase of the HAD superfamily